MKSLKILIYDTNFVKGISRMIPLLKIHAWQKEDCDITILCTNEGEEFYRSKVQHISFVPVQYTYKIKNAYSLPWQYIKITLYALARLPSIYGKFDVVYSQSAIIDFLFVPWILKLLDRKIKWFVMVDNLVPRPHERPGPYIKKLLPYLAFLFGNMLLKKADGIFVVTDFLKDYYQSRGYKVIKTGDGYGIDINIFKGSIAKTIPSYDALYCGRLHEAKGVFDLLEVMREIVKVKKNFTLGIMGDGEDIVKETLRKRITSYKLEKNVYFTGYVSGKQKGDILRNSKLFLFLSYDEGCPHAVIEAFAVNKLVLAYNLPIYHTVFKKYIDNQQLILFSQKEYKEIAKYILGMDNRRYSFNNKLEMYTWDDIVRNELTAMKK